MTSHIKCTMFRLLRDNLNKDYYLYCGHYFFDSVNQNYNIIQEINKEKADYINVPEFEIEGLDLIKGEISLDTPIFKMTNGRLCVNFDYEKNTNS